MRRLKVNLRHAELTNDIRALIEIDAPLVVRTREVISDVALLVAFFCAEKCRSGQFANLTAGASEFLLGEVEVEELSVGSFFDFSGPEGTIHVDELINVEWDESACHFTLTMLLAKDTEKLLLGIIH